MSAGGGPDVRLLATAITGEQDVFDLRRDGRVIAEALGFDQQDQIRLATALSELGRDRLGGPGTAVEFYLAADAPPALRVVFRWNAGSEPSAESLESAARLVWEVSYEPEAQRRRIIVRQRLDARGGDLADLGRRAAAAVRGRVGTSREEDLRAQTRDLIVALEEARAQSEELLLLNQELEQTNAGVLALYAELSSELEQTNSGVVALHTELEQKSQQLREASEAKTRFWANVSHELRTPLNSVIGLARLLESAPEHLLGPEQRRQAALIATSGDTLRALVDELLDVAKAESGQLVPQPGPVDLPLLLAQLDGTMHASARPGVVLTVERPAEPLTVLTDETMLTRVLRNLLSNSLKFTAEGEVRLRVRHGSAGGSRWVEFEITDTGVGIAPEEQARVFEEFYQVRGPHQRAQAGTGLGLPYARRVTELLGGTLTLTSALGQGTSVLVRLPGGPGPHGDDVRSDDVRSDDLRSDDLRSDDVHSDDVRSDHAHSDYTRAAGAARIGTIATVDDDPAFTASIRPLLERLATRIIAFDDPRRMLEAIRRDVPDAALIDLNMPEIDGYQVVRRLADDEVLSAIPVVVVTALPAESVDRARLAHARAILEKGEGLTADALAAALGIVLPPDTPDRG